MSENRDKMEVKGLSFYYGAKQALKDINLNIREGEITALIGPSGCGKTTFLRCLNRMHDLYAGNRYEGEILLEGKNILKKGIDLIKLRSRIGMVFQKPTPFPMSISENIAVRKIVPCAGKKPTRRGRPHYKPAAKIRNRRAEWPATARESFPFISKRRCATRISTTR